MCVVDVMSLLLMNKLQSYVLDLDCITIIVVFLQRVSIACYAERCISYSKSVRPSVRLSVRPSVCLSVRHTLALTQNDTSYDHGVFTGG